MENYPEINNYKSMVERALKEYFTSPCVHRKNKSIKVDGNTYRKQADTVPAFGMHHIYNSDNKDYSNYNEGITIYADDGQVINNFPKQHIALGRSKNVATNHYYKKMVRIAKKLRYMMEDYGYHGATNVSSFGVESLLWNISNDVFKKYINYLLKLDMFHQHHLVIQEMNISLKNNQNRLNQNYFYWENYLLYYLMN